MGGKLSFHPAIQHIREDGSQTSLLLRPCMDAMNEAVTEVLYELALFLLFIPFSIAAKATLPHCR